MSKPVFNNRQNKAHKVEDGRIVWESRSCAVTSVVQAVVNGQRYVALGTRGMHLDDGGKKGTACGYIDWDENALEAAMREVWEEFGLDVRDEAEWGYDYQPWKVDSSPSANRQNITLRFWFLTHCSTLPKLSAENAEEGEVTDLEWVPVQDALNMELAFNHRELLREFFETRYPEQFGSFGETDDL